VISARVVKAAGILSVVVLLTVIPASLSATPPPYLTTGLVASGLKWTSIAGYQGIEINYTNSYSAPQTAIILVDITNSAGQTSVVAAGAASFSANQLVICFVPVVGLTAGATYSASVFATTTSNVPISTVSTLQVAA
jgi:hypothetical protein